MRAESKSGPGAPHAGSRNHHRAQPEIFQDSPDGKSLTARLGGRWHGSYGVAACPVCQPERRRDQAALVISDGDHGRLLLSCKRAGCAFLDILAAAGIRPGAVMRPDQRTRAQVEEGRNADAQRKARLARRHWAESLPIQGTLAERYLRSRGITGVLLGTLRYLPLALHGPSGQRFPAMVALVRGGPGSAIHRTFLRPDGMGKAEVVTPRLALGQIRGGAVPIQPGRGRLAVAEGIESALSLARMLGPDWAVWAALSTAGMRALILPRPPGALLIAPDGDDAGRAAADALARRARGWRVALRLPPDRRDWNDVVREAAPCA